MNWFTRGLIGSRTPEEKQKLFDADGGCDHVEKDINLAYALRSEKDSFGPVSTYVCCQACDTKAKEEADNEECTCRDCLKKVKAKDGVEWKWYDFYAAQGDEPLFICNACRKLPKHLDRVAKDQADYDAEFGERDDVVEFDDD